MREKYCITCQGTTGRPSRRGSAAGRSPRLDAARSIGSGAARPVSGAPMVRRRAPPRRRVRRSPQCRVAAVGQSRHEAFRFSCRESSSGIQPFTSPMRTNVMMPNAPGRVPYAFRSVPVHAARAGRCAAGRRRRKPGRGAAGGQPCPGGCQSPGARRSGGRAASVTSACSPQTPARRASSQPSCVLSGGAGAGEVAADRPPGRAPVGVWVLAEHGRDRVPDDVVVYALPQAAAVLWRQAPVVRRHVPHASVPAQRAVLPIVRHAHAGVLAPWPVVRPVRGIVVRMLLALWLAVVRRRYAAPVHADDHPQGAPALPAESGRGRVTRGYGDGGGSYTDPPALFVIS